MDLSVWTVQRGRTPRLKMHPFVLNVRVARLPTQSVPSDAHHVMQEEEHIQVHVRHHVTIGRQLVLREHMPKHLHRAPTVRLGRRHRSRVHKVLRLALCAHQVTLKMCLGRVHAARALKARIQPWQVQQVALLARLELFRRPLDHRALRTAYFAHLVISKILLGQAHAGAADLVHSNPPSVRLHASSALQGHLQMVRKDELKKVTAENAKMVSLRMRTAESAAVLVCTLLVVKRPQLVERGLKERAAFSVKMVCITVIASASNALEIPPYSGSSPYFFTCWRVHYSTFFPSGIARCQP